MPRKKEFFWYTLPEMTDVLRGVIPAEENQEETGCSADGCRLNW